MRLTSACGRKGQEEGKGTAPREMPSHPFEPSGGKNAGRQELERATAKARVRLGTTSGIPCQQHSATVRSEGSGYMNM